MTPHDTYKVASMKAAALVFQGTGEPRVGINPSPEETEKAVLRPSKVLYEYLRIRL